VTACLDAERLGAVVDGAADAAAIAHVADCATCGARVAELEALGAALRRIPVAWERAPASLHATLRGLEAGASSEGKLRRRSVAGFVAAIAAAAALFLAPEGGGVSAALADEAAASHLRAFAKNAACEVESEDPALLGAWLRTGLGLGGEVEVPLRPGVELVGARRCSLFGEMAGAVVYRAGGETVTMFVPTPGSAAARACARAVGSCRAASGGQTVCVVEGRSGPRVVVGELPAQRLCEVAQGG